MGTYSLNLNTLTLDAYRELCNIDRKFIGTKDYIGLVYFHNYGYRHILRDDPSISQRKRIHAELLKRDLKVDGISKEHNEVIAKILTGTISKISGTAWTREGILNY